MEDDLVDAAIGGPHLVLRSDMLADHVLLDMDGLPRQLLLADHAAVERVQRGQQADREGRARPQAGAGRQVAVMVDLEAAIDLHLLQHVAHRRVADLGQLAHVLDEGIDDAVLVLEEGRQPADADVAVFVDGKADHPAAMPAIPDGIVGAAAEQRDAERRAADDHVARRRRAAPKKPSPSARLSGVPMSMNGAATTWAWSVPGGSRPSRSSSEGRSSRIRRSSRGSPNR